MKKMKKIYLCQHNNWVERLSICQNLEEGIYIG